MAWAKGTLTRAVPVALTNLQERVVRMDNARYHGGLRPPGTTIDLIVWHATGGDTITGALSWLNRVLKDGEAKGSYHYGIEKDGTIRRLLPVSHIAYHAGRSEFPCPDAGARVGRSVNKRSIGIAFANDNGADNNLLDDPLTPEQMESGLWLARVLCDRYLIPSDANVGHLEVARHRKTDPLHRICPMPQWRQAIQLVRQSHGLRGA